MKKFSLSLLVLLTFIGLTNNTFCQLQVLRDQGTGIPVLANPYPEVKGTPYWSEFEIGKIIFSEKDTASNLVIAFNAFNHTLVYSMDRELLAYSPGKISGFILSPENNPQIFRSGYMIPNIGKNRFVEVLVDGDYTLVNHKYKKMIDDPGATYGSQRAKTFANAEDLYLYKDGQPFLWKSRRKNLIEIFGEEGYKKVNELANTYNLDLTQKNDIKRLVYFLNSGV
ncbi:hypothetical protein [Shivajiella indica]|uniref:6-bladed beta-propeller n=1 Tax=Shivajiella indica TaxID=872115 RepID=A0ABW5B4R0_9BACT